MLDHPLHFALWPATYRGAVTELRTYRRPATCATVRIFGMDRDTGVRIGPKPVVVLPLKSHLTSVRDYEHAAESADDPSRESR